MLEEIDSATVEPMLDAYNTYANDTIGLILSPMTLLFVMFWNKETQIPFNYGITSGDLRIYLIYSIVIIIFQFGTLTTYI